MSRPHGSHVLRYAPGLDGIRALAVAAVIAYHLGTTSNSMVLPGGFLGVDLFFVLSGYLITTLLMVEAQQHRRISIRQFYLRRARRLLPALFTVLLTVGAIGVVWLPQQAVRLRGDLLAALGYATNWWLIALHSSYFTPDSDRPDLLTHLWSLAVEEQYYLVWPVVLLLFYLIRAPRWFMLVVVLAAVAASTTAAYMLYDPYSDPSRVYYGTDTRALAPLLGAALAIAVQPWRHRTKLPRATRHALDALGVLALLALAVVAAVLSDSDAVLYGAGFLGIAALGAVAVGVAGHPGTALGEMLGTQPLKWLGERSYGLYLWHWPVCALTRPAEDVPLTGWANVALRVGLSLLLAEISYHLIEVPIRRHGFFAPFKRRPATTGRHPGAAAEHNPVGRAAVGRAAVVGVPGAVPGIPTAGPAGQEALTAGTAGHSALTTGTGRHSAPTTDTALTTGTGRHSAPTTDTALTTGTGRRSAPTTGTALTTGTGRHSGHTSGTGPHSAPTAAASGHAAISGGPPDNVPPTGPSGRRTRTAADGPRSAAGRSGTAPKKRAGARGTPASRRAHRRPSRVPILRTVAFSIVLLAGGGVVGLRLSTAAALPVAGGPMDAGPEQSLDPLLPATTATLGPDDRPVLPPPLPAHPKVAFFGDSQGMTLLINKPANTDTFLTAIDATISGCGVLLGRVTSRSGEKRNLTANCRNWQPQWTSNVAKYKPDLSIVMIGAWDVFDLTLDTGGTLAFTSPEWDANFGQAVGRGVDILKAGGSQVGLALLPCYRPIKASAGFWPERGDDDRTRHVNDLLRATAARYGDVRTLSPPGQFCDSPAIGKDTAYRWDGVHYYKKGSALYFAALIPQLLPPPPPSPGQTGPSQAEPSHTGPPPTPTPTAAAGVA